jgi:hypothetical protein
VISSGPLKLASISISLSRIGWLIDMTLPCQIGLNPRESTHPPKGQQSSARVMGSSVGTPANESADGGRGTFVNGSNPARHHSCPGVPTRARTAGAICTASESGFGFALTADVCPCAAGAPANTAPPASTVPTAHSAPVAKPNPRRFILLLPMTTPA